MTTSQGLRFRFWGWAGICSGAVAAWGAATASVLAADRTPAAVESPREIRVQLPMEPVSLDPAHADDDGSMRVLGNTIDGLVGFDPNGKLENLLAESYKISADRKTYTFTLRKGAVWSDGKPVRPEDFIYGIKRTLDPKTGAKLANMMFAIRGAKDFNAGKAPADQVGVAAKGGKVVVTLEKPASYFIEVLAMAQAAPMREDVVAANGGSWPETAPVTGPYVIDSHILETDIHLTPNPRHWRFNKRSLPVSFKIVSDESTAQSLFESGKLDIVTRPSPIEFPRFKAKGVAYAFPHAATYFISFSTKKPPFDDREMRQAVAGAISRKEILESFNIPNRDADGWVPPELLSEPRKFKVDPRVFEKAVKSVAAKLKAHPVVGVTANFNTSTLNSNVLEKIQFDLHKVLGLDIQLSGLDWKSYMALVRSDTPQIYRFQRGAAVMDPAWHMLSFKSDDANNPTGWKNAEYDKLVDKILELAPGPARQKLIEKAEKILTEDEAIVVPLFFPNQTYLIADRVQGVHPNPVNVALFAGVTVK